MKSISLDEQRNPNFLNRDSNTNEIQTQCSVQCPSTEISHWSKWTLIPLLIWRTFNHSRRWEMIKEL